MLKYDEYTGVPEIVGLVYGANCPLYINNESNGNYVCGMKYGDDTFPNVDLIRLFIFPDTHDSLGIMICQSASTLLLPPMQSLTLPFLR